MAKEVSLKNVDVVNSLGAIQRLIMSSESLPIGLTIACHDNIETLEDYTQELDEYKEDLLEEYAVFDDEGNIQTVDNTEDVENTNGEADEEDLERPPNQGDEIKFKSDEARENYIEELNDKYDEEATLELKTVSSDLVEEIEVSPQVAISLSWMFE